MKMYKNKNHTEKLIMNEHLGLMSCHQSTPL